MTSSKKISDLLLKIYQTKPTEHLCSHFLSVLEEYIPATISSYMIMNMETGELTIQGMRHLKGGVLPVADEVSARANHHPFIEYYLKKDAGSVLCTTDIMSDEEWKKTEIYNTFHRQYGVFYDHSVRFYAGSECISFIFSDSVPITMDHRRLLTLIAPHLANAYNLHRRQQNNFMRSIPGNMLLLDKAGHVLESGEGSLRLLEKYLPEEGAWPVQGVPLRVVTWFGALLKQNRTTNSGLSSLEDKLCLRRNDGQSLVMSLYHTEENFLIIMEETISLRMIDVLRNFDLSLREAEVMIWVAQGKQNSEVATILEIRPATVRKHMEHVLQKLGCETRGAAAHLITGMISDQLPYAKCHCCTRTNCTECDL